MHCHAASGRRYAHGGSFGPSIVAFDARSIVASILAASA
jgi:hypothetical protein